MTRPPGQQPPQEGFGAPYDPPPGPGPYPQSGSGPYPPSGPSGAQPGPYDPPSGPYGQQAGPYGGQPQGGYGYPPQQHPGAPVPGPPGPAAAPPGGPGRFRALRRKPVLLIGAALAVLLIAGAGVRFATGDGGGDDGKKPVAGGSADTGQPSASPSGGRQEDTADLDPGVEELNAGRRPGEAKVLWLQRNTVDLPGSGAAVHGPWMAGDIVAKGMYRTVSGYSVADGKERWSLRLPADICSAPSLPTDDGKIVIGIAASSTDDTPDCSVLQMIDLRTGKAGWKKTVPSNGLLDIQSEVSMSVNGDTVTYARAGGADAYRISDGTKLFGRQPGDCQPHAFTSGPRMIAFVGCSDSPAGQIQEVDPVTGKAKWAYELEPGWSLEKLYSVDPLVVTLTDFEESRTIALRDDGTLRSQIDGVLGSAGTAADADTLYVATKFVYAGDAITNKVAAYDLDTGKRKWQADAPHGQAMVPLRMEGTDVLLHVRASKTKGGAIATLAPNGGVPEMLLTHPESAADTEDELFSAKVTYVDGRCILTNPSVASDSDANELKITTMMVFGE